jgi:integrase
MQVKSKVFKRKTGKSKNKWIVRLEFFDEIKGKKSYMERHADRKTDATDLRNKLVDEVKKSHGQIQTGERMTFNDLAAICEKNFYQPAEFAEGRKISGVRSFVTAKALLNVLRQFFGKRLLREIMTESLFDYKRWRLKTDSERTGEPVKISTVNRELSIMRKMMRFAFGKGWILKDVFFNAKVIDASAEIERHRLLTFDEEKRLLEACGGEREVDYTRTRKSGKKEAITATISVNNPHLKAMIILAIDSGLRRGEIFKISWNDIDFDNGIIRVLGTHTKTERERLAPLSERAKLELEKLKEISSGANPFPLKDIKRSFATAKKLAKIDDLHFHDLRRTAITRWIQQGTPLALAGKFAGHSQLQTTMKHYTATDAGMIQELNERMNTYNSQIEKPLTSEMVN